MGLPSGYTQLKYIQSSGAQYIDSGIIPTANTRVVMVFQLNEANAANQALFAVDGQFSFRWYGAGSRFRSNGGNNINFPTTIDGAAKHTVDKTATFCTIDGTHSVTTTAGTVTLSLYLLAQNAADGVSSYASAKLYSCQIYDNETLVRDFVPVKNSSGIVGLYDLAHGTFYTNAGSGTFTAPLATGPVEGAGVSLVEGVSYGFNDGKCLVGGTAYAITEGKALVDGTWYDVSFGPNVIPVTIKGTGSSSYCYATINGTKYVSAASGIEVHPGDTIIFGISGTADITDGYVKVDGVTLASRTSGRGEYAWTVPEGVKTISMVFSCSTSARYYGRITVTTAATSGSGAVPVEITWSPNTGGSYSYVEINGTKYTENETLTVAEGTVATIVCEERETTTKYWECTGYVRVNGSSVLTVYPGDSGTYTINNAVTIYMNRISEDL